MEPKKGQYDLPGGFMDMGDDSMETAIYREIKEELGINKSEISDLTYLGSASETYPWHGTELVNLVLLYSCVLPADAEPVIADTNENSRLRWIGKQDLATIELAWQCDQTLLKKHFEVG